MEEVSSELIATRSRLDRVEKEATEAKAKTAELTQARDTITALHAEVTQLQSSLAKKQEVAEFVEKEISEMRQLFQVKESKILKRHQMELEEKDRELMALQYELRDHAAKIENGQTKVAKLQEQLAASEAARVRADAHVVEVEGEMRELLQEVGSCCCSMM